jgi:hypothetical protein
MIGVALQDYTPNNDNSEINDMISIKKGDILNNIVKVEGDWWYGEISSDIKGYFPKSYVEITEESPDDISVVTHDACYLEEYEHSINTSDMEEFMMKETLIRANDINKDNNLSYSRMEKFAAEGTNHKYDRAKSGVSEISDNASYTSADNVDEVLETLNGLALASYFPPASDTSIITFTKGEHITNIITMDGDWWYGENSKGQKGYFPKSFVEILDEGEDDDNISENEKSLQSSRVNGDASAVITEIEVGHTSSSSNADMPYTKRTSKIDANIINRVLKRNSVLNTSCENTDNHCDVNTFRGMNVCSTVVL